MFSNFVITCLCCFSFLYVSILSSPDPLLQDLAKHTGYIETNGASMFYYFFEKIDPPRPSSPVILWLTGILGLSCSVAIFHQNGPFRLIETNEGEAPRLETTEYGWNKLANIIYVEDPVGTGFSRDDLSLIRDNENDIVNDLFFFLKGFFKNEKYRHLRNNEFYIVAQSYAGKYAPTLASLIYEDNESKRENVINLMGVAIGNGLTNPIKLFATLPEFAEEMGLIENQHSLNIKQKSEECQAYAGTINNDDFCSLAYESCHSLLEEIAGKTTNIYNIKKPKETDDLYYDFTNVKRFLDKMSVKRALGVRKPARVFRMYNYHGFESMMTKDYMKNDEENVVFLLESGINVLVYGGVYDLQCNPIGNLKWVEELDWLGSTGFKESHRDPFMVDNVDSGFKKKHENLEFVLIYEAGEMVAMDQPKVTFQMMERWMQDASRENNA